MAFIGDSISFPRVYWSHLPAIIVDVECVKVRFLGTCYLGTGYGKDFDPSLLWSLDVWTGQFNGYVTDWVRGKNECFWAKLDLWGKNQRQLIELEAKQRLWLKQARRRRQRDGKTRLSFSLS